MFLALQCGTYCNGINLASSQTYSCFLSVHPITHPQSRLIPTLAANIFHTVPVLSDSFGHS